MGLPPYPTTAEAGILCVILLYAANFISIVQGKVFSILQFLGIHIPKFEEASVDSPSGSFDFNRGPSKSYIEELRRRTPERQYDNYSEHERECMVCLTEFEPRAWIYLLSCGHFLHITCLETWLKYWYVTCPLCRTQIIPLEEEEYINPMWDK